MTWCSGLLQVLSSVTVTRESFGPAFFCVALPPGGVGSEAARQADPLICVSDQDSSCIPPGGVAVKKNKESEAVRSFSPDALLKFRHFLVDNLDLITKRKGGKNKEP